MLQALSGGPQRFGGLRKRVGGGSERKLAQTPRGLETDGLVLRRDFGTVPPHVEYERTPLGQQAAARVGALRDRIQDGLPGIARNAPNS